MTALHRAGSDLTRLKQLPVTLREGDLADQGSLIQAMPEGVDAVFHVAANVTHWTPYSRQQEIVNVDGTRHMLEAALRKHAGRFVHTSSIAAFGFHDTVITEDTPSTALESGVSYFRTKRLGELEVDRAIERGLDAVILNPCNVMGPWDYHNMSRLLIAVHRGLVPGVPPGGATFCHVREVVKAHLSAFYKGRRGERYILGGTEATYLELVGVIGRLMGKRVPKRTIPAGVLMALVRLLYRGSLLVRKEPFLTPELLSIAVRQAPSCSDKAVRELGYQPVELEEIVGDCVEWVAEEGLLRQKGPTKDTKETKKY